MNTFRLPPMARQLGLFTVLVSLPLNIAGGDAAGSDRVVTAGAVDPLDDPDARAVVLLFARTDCPISNRYAPRVRRLYEAYAPQDVSFWMVYPDPRTTEQDVAQHLDEYRYPFGAILDPQHQLVDHCGATTTPEAAVFAPGGRRVYRGRIDNWYADFGKARPKPTTHELRDAIEAVLAGRPVERPVTKAVGCFITDLK